MKLVQFIIEEDSLPSKTGKVGILKNDVIVDCTHETLPSSLVEILNQENGLETLISVASKSTKTYPLSGVKLLSPITKPDKILGVGLNYKEHCDKLKLPHPSEPIIFSKFASTIVGPFDNIVKPTSELLDWEVELVVVIGKKAKQIAIEDAYDHVLGYMVAQDLTAMDWLSPNKNGGQWLLGKSRDTFCPLGPWVVTKDEIDDPHGLRLRSWVNGVLKQDNFTSELIHGIDKLISYLSDFMTLYPGDIILTGTPSGMAFFQEPRETLQPGDIIESEVENIGKIRNQVV